MGRKQRPFEFFTNHAVTMPTGSGANNTTLGVVVPEDGAYVREMIVTVRSAGSGGQTITFNLLDSATEGSVVLLTESPSILASAVFGTIVSANGLPMGGTGAACRVKGDRILFRNTNSGALGGASQVTVAIVWQM